MLSDKGHVLEYLLSFNLLSAESDVIKLDLLVIKLFVYLISIMQRSPTRVFLSWHDTCRAVSGGVSKYSLSI